MAQEPAPLNGAGAGAIHHSIYSIFKAHGQSGIEACAD
jgi:hypothetical protein